MQADVKGLEKQKTLITNSKKSIFTFFFRVQVSAASSESFISDYFYINSRCLMLEVIRGFHFNPNENTCLPKNLKEASKCKGTRKGNQG